MQRKVIHVRDSIERAIILGEMETCLKDCTIDRRYPAFTSLPELVDFARRNILASLQVQAEESQRKRAIRTIHEMNPDNTSDSRTNVMFNYFQYGTYVMPHNHLEKNEYFQCLEGQLAIVIYNEQFKITDVKLLSQHELIKVPVGQIHTVVCLSPEACVLEIKDGPYDPKTDKVFVGQFPAEKYEHGRLTEEAQKAPEELEASIRNRVGA